MLDLTDGDQTVKGMEYQAIKELHSDLTPGTKVYIHYIYIIHIYMYTCIIKFQSAFGLGQKFENMFVKFKYNVSLFLLLFHKSSWVLRF